jgi:hypothetical protein
MATEDPSGPEGAIARPPISVTVSTGQGWSEIGDAIRTTIDSVRDAGGELVVTDSSDEPPPGPDVLGDDVIWAKFPGESVFQLRVRGYQLATGELIAVTEDHVQVPRDWARRLLEAHAAHPEAVAIGGSVVNGATKTIIDWASFLVVQSAVAAPIRSGPARRLSGAVNVCYRRSAVEHIDAHHGLGAMDGLHQRQLAEAGAVMLNDDSIRVSHVQEIGWRGTTAGHYNAARTMSGFRRLALKPVDVVRIIGAPFVPLARYVVTVRRLAPRGYGPQLLRCTPAILWLLYVQGWGQFVGYLAGPGDSPGKVQ